MPSAGDEPLSIGQALRWIALDPWDALGRRWNYKAAVLSSLMRAGVFFAINATAGRDAAMSAMTTEFFFRFTTSGFYGAMTQAFRRVEPAGTAMFAAMILLPAVSHSLEFVVHAWRGTAVLATSIGASVALTAISTAFNLFAMRHGVLVTGHDHQSLASDLAEMPRLLALFVATVARGCARRLARG